MSSPTWGTQNPHTMMFLKKTDGPVAQWLINLARRIDQQEERIKQINKTKSFKNQNKI